MNQWNIYQSSDVNNIETFSCDGMNGIATKTNDIVATKSRLCKNGRSILPEKCAVRHWKAFFHQSPTAFHSQHSFSPSTKSLTLTFLVKKIVPGNQQAPGEKPTRFQICNKIKMWKNAHTRSTFCLFASNKMCDRSPFPLKTVRLSSVDGRKDVQTCFRCHFTTLSSPLLPALYLTIHRLFIYRNSLDD